MQIMRCLKRFVGEGYFPGRGRSDKQRAPAVVKEERGVLAVSVFCKEHVLEARGDKHHALTSPQIAVPLGRANFAELVLGCIETERSTLCRSRRELSNAYFLAKFGFNTAENEPCQVCPIEQCSSGQCNRMKQGASVWFRISAGTWHHKRVMWTQNIPQPQAETSGITEV